MIEFEVYILSFLLRALMKLQVVFPFPILMSINDDVTPLFPAALNTFETFWRSPPPRERETYSCKHTKVFKKNTKNKKSILSLNNKSDLMTSFPYEKAFLNSCR